MAATSLAFKYTAPDDLELQKFGRTVGIAFLFIAGVCVWKDWAFARPGALIALYLLVGATFSVAVLKPAHKFWLFLSHYMGLVMNTLVLSVFYFVILTPIGFALRNLGKLHYSNKGGWKKRDYTPNYEKQY